MDLKKIKIGETVKADYKTDEQHLTSSNACGATDCQHYCPKSASNCKLERISIGAKAECMNYAKKS